MEKRQFIQVVQTYQDRNKLNKQLREKLQEFDRLLVRDIHQADHLIRENCLNITNSYKGTAKVPMLRVSEFSDHRRYYIADCITIDVTPVRTLEPTSKF